ncbi:MAG: hypothetical protein LBM25_01210 [Bacteroidales bacterium]|jgi:hypothetical protein|nr:hypothetical protein [Bacteroidales bacterium]
MKKFFLLLILIGSCFTTLNAQKEKFFSFEVSANTKNLFSKNISYRNDFLDILADKSNYEISFLPAFNIGRFKFSTGLSYGYSNYYKISKELLGNSNYVTDFEINYTNIPINIGFNIYKSNRIWLNCFLGYIFSIVNDGTEIFYSEQGYTAGQRLERTNGSMGSEFYMRFGLEFSLIAFKNLKINITPFANCYIYGDILLMSYYAEINKSNTRKMTSLIEITTPSSFNPVSLGISVGVEYMFRFGKKN